MGMLFTEVTFEGELPNKTALQEKLAIATGLQVHLETVDDDIAANRDDSELEDGTEWKICFESVADNFKGEVWILRHGNTIDVQELADSLNRCPNYLLFAVETALVELGGRRAQLRSTSESKKHPPDYALGNFEQWKESNRGTRPPLWKVVLACFGMAAYIAAVCIAGIIALPILLILVIALWAKERRRVV